MLHVLLLQTRPCIDQVSDRGGATGHGVGLDRERGRAQTGPQVVEVGVDQQGSVMQHVGFAVAEGVAGEFFSRMAKAVAHQRGGFDPVLAEGMRQSVQDCVQLIAFPGKDEGVVEVARVLIDGTASTDAPGDLNFVAAAVVQVQFPPGILVFSHDDGGLATPEQQTDLFGLGIEKMLFQGEMGEGIQAFGGVDDHGVSVSVWAGLHNAHDGLSSPVYVLLADFVSSIRRTGLVQGCGGAERK